MPATCFPALPGRGRQTRLNIHVCYPVWKFAGYADPFRTAMDAITRGGYEPEYEAALIQSVFDMAHAARYRAEAGLSPLLPASFVVLREAVDQLVACHG